MTTRNRAGNSSRTNLTSSSVPFRIATTICGAASTSALTSCGIASVSDSTRAGIRSGKASNPAATLSAKSSTLPTMASTPCDPMVSSVEIAVVSAVPTPGANRPAALSADSPAPITPETSPVSPPAIIDSVPVSMKFCIPDCDCWRFAIAIAISSSAAAYSSAPICPRVNAIVASACRLLSSSIADRTGPWISSARSANRSRRPPALSPSAAIPSVAGSDNRSNVSANVIASSLASPRTNVISFPASAMSSSAPPPTGPPPAPPAPPAPDVIFVNI